MPLFVPWESFGVPSASFGSPLALVLHPGILVAGAAAAAIPIVIHLLNRRRVQPRPWAAMTWLLAAVRKHQRRLRMENWLVLLLRTLALLLLGAALSRVVVNDSALDALVRPRRSYVLLLDTSYSTGARDGSRSVCDRVREEAERVLSGVSGDDVVAVVVSNDVRPDRSGVRANVIVPRSVGADAVTRAKTELVGLRPTEARASWSEAIAAASPRALLEEGDPNRTLVWITDLQAVDWNPAEARSGGDGPATTAESGALAISTALETVRRSGCEIRIVDANGAPGRSLPNLAVVDVAPLEEGDVFQGQAFSLKVRVASYGEQPVSRCAIRVFLDDAVTPVAQATVPPLAAARVSPLAVAEQTVVVKVDKDSSFKTPGAHVVRVEVLPSDAEADADALLLDSRRTLALDVRARLHVVAWVQKGREARWDPTNQVQGVFAGDDGRASDTFTFRAVSGEDDLRRLLDDPQAEVDLLVLANREPRGDDLARKIAAFVRGGGALVAFVGDAFDPVAWNRAFHDSADQRLLPWTFGPLVRRAKDDPEDRYLLDLEHPTSHPLSQALAGEGETANWVRQVPLRLNGFAPLLPDAPPPKPPGAAVAKKPAESVVFRFRREPGTDGPGAVAAVEGPFGLGRSLWFGMGIDDAWNPNVVLPFLLVFLNDSALLLTRRPTAGRNVEVGQVLRTLLPKDYSNVKLLVPGRGGVVEETPIVHPAASEEDRPEVVHDRIGTTGVWRLTYARPAVAGSGTSTPRTVTEVFSVSPSPEEGVLLRARREDVAERSRGADAVVLDSWAESSTEKPTSNEGEITSPLLLAVLAFLLLEPFLAMRFGRHGERAEKEAA